MAKFVYTFVPRNLVDEPASFGKTHRALPVAPGADQASAQFNAAQLQHVVSFAVRDQMLAEKTTLRKVLLSIGQHKSVNHHERVLRGETMMQLADLMMWAQIFPRIGALVSRTLIGPKQALPEGAVEEGS